LKVKIAYLNSQGRDNIIDVIEMLSKDRGPLTFELLENNYSSDYFRYHRDLTKISIDDLKELSKLIRSDHSIKTDDFVVVISQKSLDASVINIASLKDWNSFYYEQNIIVRSGGWSNITEGKPYLAIAHQIIENIFQNLGMIDLNSIRLQDSIHMETEVCINDFCEKPNETKGKIRSGYICRSCTESALNHTTNDYVIQIKNILSRISNRLRENYDFNFSDDELKIQVTENYKIEIGGHLLDFGHKGKLSHIVYLFYLINHNGGFGRKDLSTGGVAREKFMALHNHIYGKIYEDEVDRYVRGITPVHSRISTRLKNQLNIEALAHKYGFNSSKTKQDVTVYNIDISPEHLSIPSDLLGFKVSY
jgi:hypothetical protein